MSQVPNLLGFSGVDSFDLSSIARSMGQGQQNTAGLIGMVDRDKHGPASLPQVQEANVPQGIKKCSMDATDIDSVSLPAPVVREGPPVNQGGGVFHINRPDPTTTSTPNLSPAHLLLRKVFGNPPTRTAAEWDKLAKKARKFWQQKNGIESTAACVELAYFSTAARWVMTRGKPDAMMYHHPLRTMAYPERYRDFLKQRGGMERYR
ncbi:MAG: hypothetical protein ACYDEQ_09285 [Desulfocucumaceae bacterium]